MIGAAGGGAAAAQHHAGPRPAGHHLRPLRAQPPRARHHGDHWPRAARVRMYSTRVSAGAHVRGDRAHAELRAALPHLRHGVQRGHAHRHRHPGHRGG